MINNLLYMRIINLKIVLKYNLLYFVTDYGKKLMR